MCTGKEYQEVKKHIQEAVQKKDASRLEGALEELALKGPQGKVPRQDETLIREAQDLHERLENQQRISSLFPFEQVSPKSI